MSEHEMKKANETKQDEVLHLMFFYTPRSPNSVQSLHKLQHFAAGCGRPVRLELIDVQKQPSATLEYKVFVTPYLIRVSPTPELRIAGSITEYELDNLFDQG